MSQSLKILVAGGTGFLGRELGRALVASGHEVTVLARSVARVRGTLPFPATIFPWAGADAEIPREAVEGRDVVVNLAGAGIADKPWTAKRRREIRDSRVESVTALARAIAGAAKKPSVFLQASAVGYFGDRGDEELDESSAAGRGFLAETCVAWEAAARRLEESGSLRVALIRFGMVLGLSGGALPKLLGVYAKGLGATLGSGRQWTSWIHVDDLTAMLVAAAADSRWRGVYHGTSPAPCRNTELNAAIGKHGRYACGKTVPSVMVKAGLGRRSALVLDSARALPRAAQRLGFTWKYPTIDAAASQLLGGAVGTNLRRFVTSQWLPLPVNRLWPFFTDAKNLEAITPPWLSFQVVGASTAEVDQGTVIDYSLRLRGLRLTWRSRITEWRQGASFVDEQVKGPYSVWHHTHRFEPLAGGTVMTDAVQYRLPLAPLGELVAGALVEGDVGRIFAFRSGRATEVSATLP